MKRFKLDWVLVDELAIGRAPVKMSHLDLLHDAGIKAVLSTCGPDEVIMPVGLDERFVHQHSVLPDHRTGRLPDLVELEAALDALAALLQQGPVFVHCVAAMERSPLVCLAWLVSRHRLTPQQALDYLMQIHSGTNPLAGQLALLDRLGFNKSSPQSSVHGLPKPLHLPF